jgi:hypothetical protein
VQAPGLENPINCADNRPSEVFMKFGNQLPVNAIGQALSGDYFRKSVVKCRFLLTSILTFYMETGK